MDRQPQPDLRPHEFACLQHRQTRLYAEIIQVVEKGRRYWARPILLCEAEGINGDALDPMPNIYDLRACADLLWPRSLFRSVLDTELIPLLAHLQPDPLDWDPVVAKSAPASLELARQKVRALTHHLWRTYPEVFQD